MPLCDKKTISFLLTTRCNLNCTYCYGNRKSEYKTLNFAFAKKILNDYAEAGDLKYIRFSADGEPTTEMELLKNIFKEAKQLEPNVQATVFTNGTFNEETAKWIAENLDYIYISADFLPEVHDAYRPTITGKPSSPPILKNLEYFSQMPGKHAKIGIRATITKENIEQQIEAIDYYYNNYGINIFWVNPIFMPVYDANEKMYEPIDMMQFAKAFIHAHDHAWRKGIFYECSFTANFDGQTQKACSACLPTPHLTVDGYLSACELATYGKNAGTMEPMIYAKYDIENDKIIYDTEKLQTLRSRTLQNMSAQCRDCVASKHCAGYCLGETLNETGSLFKVKTSVCIPIRYLYGEIGHLYQEKFGDKGFPHRYP
jgi:radical SAM protein with 4Fe4S-binding SPASM domain